MRIVLRPLSVPMVLRWLTAVLGLWGSWVGPFSTIAAAGFTGPEVAATAERNAPVTRVVSTVPRTLNPLLTTLEIEDEIATGATIFESLLATDPDSGKLECWLCLSWELGADHRTATFKLRPDVKFHDGAPLTTADVKFSFEVAQHPKVQSPRAANLRGLIKVEELGDHQVRLTFAAPSFAQLVHAGKTPIVPKHLFANFDKAPERFAIDSKFAKSPLGSGPYRFGQWVTDKWIELERHDDWWGFKDPTRFGRTFNFRRLRFRFATSDEQVAQLMKRGEGDFAELPSYIYDDMAKGGGTGKALLARLDGKAGGSYLAITWNVRRPIFQEARTREALALLTDRPGVMAKLSRGLRPLANGPFGSQSPYQCPPGQCRPAAFDPARAKALLAAAGWRQGERDSCLTRRVGAEEQTLRFNLAFADGDWTRAAVATYVAEFRRAGACVEAKPMEASALDKQIEERAFDALFAGFPIPEPVSPRDAWHSASAGKEGGNLSGWSDPELDKLIDAFDAEFDEAKRQALGREIHRRLYDAHAALWHHESGGCLIATSKSLKGVESAPFAHGCSYWPRWYKLHR